MKKFLAEFLGSLLLGASVVGSGIMASVLTGDIALQLFINMTVTVLALFLVISLFNPISGGFFNPLVTLTDLLSRKILTELALTDQPTAQSELAKPAPQHSITRRWPTWC